MPGSSGFGTARSTRAAQRASCLVPVDRVAGAGRAWRSGDRQGRLPDTIALLLLAPVIRVKVNKSDPTDLYEQVAAEIRRAIADGEAKPGERLPPAKDLAAILDVNTNTVLRSLRLLRDEGLLEFRRGRGIKIGRASCRERVYVLV